MSQAKDFLAIIETDYHNFEKYFKSLLNNYTRILNFFERIFSVLPIEFLFILLFSILLLYILNSVSREHKKINLFVSVLLATLGIYLLIKVGILNKKKQAESINRVLISPLLILGPAFLYYFIILGIKNLIKKWNLRKLANLSSLESAIFNLQITYKQTMQEYYSLESKNYLAEDLKSKLVDLQIITDRLVEILKRQSIQNESKVAKTE